MAHFGFPYRVDGRGRTEGADEQSHVKQLIEQLLFVAPGERINRPTYGSAVRQMLFSPLSNETAATLQFMLQGALQQWLGDIIQVTSITVQTVDTSVQVTVQYIVRRSRRAQVAQLTREI